MHDAAVKAVQPTVGVPGPRQKSVIVAPCYRVPLALAHAWIAAARDSAPSLA
jgi:hypothetical protein